MAYFSLPGLPRQSEVQRSILGEFSQANKSACGVESAAGVPAENNLLQFSQNLLSGSPLVGGWRTSTTGVAQGLLEETVTSFLSISLMTEGMLSLTDSDQFWSGHLTGGLSVVLPSWADNSV